MTPERAADWKPGFPLWGAARVFADMERWDEAAEFRRQAAQAFADDGNRGGQAVQLEYLGHALQMAGRLEEALNAYRKSHEAGMTPERVGDWKPGFSLSGAAAVLFSMERWEEAVECRRQAAQAFADDGDRGGQAVQLDLLGDALRRAGRSEDALQAYMDAVHTGMTPERAPDWSPAAPLSDAALVLAELERWDEAAEFRRQAAQAFADDGNRGGQAVELELLGHALRVVGRLDDALDAYLKSHEAGMTPERVPDWKPGDSLTNAAGVLDALERWDEAIAYRRRAVEMYAADGDRREQALELEFLGDSLVELDRLGDALDCYRQSHSVGMLPEPVANWDPARSLMEAARVLTQQGRLGPANDMFAEAVKQALALRNRTDDGSHAPTLLLTTTEWGRMLADHEGRIAALEAMEAGRAAALSIEGHGDAARWKLEHCVDWWSLQSELLSAIGDRAEAEDASRRADALRARIAAMEEE
jgi:tetratricopeptide (TPR) repeat protein